MNYHIQLFQILCFLMFIYKVWSYISWYETIFWLYSPSIFCQSASYTTLSLQLYQYHHLLLLTYLLIFITNVYICAVFCTNTFIWCYAIQNLVTPSLKLFLITRCYTSHRCFSVFLMSSNLPFTAQQFLIEPG
jgi:hypothetical protein